MPTNYVQHAIMLPRRLEGLTSRRIAAELDHLPQTHTCRGKGGIVLDGLHQLGCRRALLAMEHESRGQWLLTRLLPGHAGRVGGRNGLAKVVDDNVGDR